MTHENRNSEPRPRHTGRPFAFLYLFLAAFVVFIAWDQWGYVVNLVGTSMSNLLTVPDSTTGWFVLGFVVLIVLYAGALLSIKAQVWLAERSTRAQSPSSH